MMFISDRIRTVCTRLWRYFTQPLGDKEQTAIFNPWRFSHASNIQFLEYCWQLEGKRSTHHPPIAADREPDIEPDNGADKPITPDTEPLSDTISNLGEP